MFDFTALIDEIIAALEEFFTGKITDCLTGFFTGVFGGGHDGGDNGGLLV